MKTLSCREAGFDCDYVVEGESEEEILQKESRTRKDGSWIERRRLHT